MISLPKDYKKSPSSESTNEDSPNMALLKGKEQDFSHHSAGMNFIKEHKGNIKEYYKISSSIGRGKCRSNTDPTIIFAYSN